MRDDLKAAECPNPSCGQAGGRATEAFPSSPSRWLLRISSFNESPQRGAAALWEQAGALEVSAEHMGRLKGSRCCRSKGQSSEVGDEEAFKGPSLREFSAQNQTQTIPGRGSQGCRERGTFPKVPENSSGFHCRGAGAPQRSSGKGKEQLCSWRSLCSSIWI